MKDSIIAVLVGFWVGISIIVTFHLVQAIKAYYEPIATPINPYSTYAIPVPTPKVERIQVVTGLASFYSRKGCLGCREDRLMANGHPLDDTKATVAYNRVALNTMVKITNIKTGKTVNAKVTDRGGFERHGKIVDLSVKTRDLLGCGHVCQVEVGEL